MACLPTKCFTTQSCKVTTIQCTIYALKTLVLKKQTKMTLVLFITQNIKMFCKHMICHGSFFRETLSTDCAQEWLLSRVNPPVVLQTGFAGHRLSTDVTQPVFRLCS